MKTFWDLQNPSFYIISLLNNFPLRSMKITPSLPISFFLILVILHNSCGFSNKKCQRLLEKAKKERYDLIIVPGVPFENGEWSRIMKARVYWSKYLLEKGIARNIMYSGAAVYSPYEEAEIMALYGKAIGIQGDKIFTETKAEHGTENIYNSYRKARILGFNKIALATDPFQAKSKNRFIQHQMHYRVAQIPIVFDTLFALDPTMADPEINYQSLKVKDFIPIGKRMNLWQFIKASRGKSLDKGIYRPASWAEKILSRNFNNFYQVDAMVYRSEKPSFMGIKELTALGIKSVLNLHGKTSRRKIRKNKEIQFNSIKINPDNISYEDILNALKFINKMETPINIHCYYGADRTGCIIAAYRMAVQGWSRKDAINEFLLGGFGYHERLFPNILFLLETIDIEKLKEDLE